MAEESLRTIVLRTAVDHIADHGPDSLSFRRVAAAAGVSHQAPYHHFSDRRGIFEAIALEGFTRFADALQRSQERVDLDPSTAPSTAMLEAYVEFAVEHRGHFRVMFRPDLVGLGDNPALAAASAASFGTLVDLVERLVGPEASVEVIRQRAVAMWSLAHGLATLLIDGPLEDEIGPVGDRQALIRAVAAQSGLGSPGAPGR